MFSQISISNLPGKVVVETGGTSLHYQLGYAYNVKGLPVSRTATGQGTSELTIYTYY